MNPQDSPEAWWASRRARYNRGLAAAGVLAFIACVIVEGVLPGVQIEEITVFTLIFQGIAYICMMGVANLFYNLGALSEKWLQLSDPGSYRRSCFRLGYRFSFALPFSVPVLLLLKGILMSLR